MDFLKYTSKLLDLLASSCSPGWDSTAYPSPGLIWVTIRCWSWLFSQICLQICIYMMTQWSHLQNKKQNMNSWKAGTSTELCESFDSLYIPLNWTNLIPEGKTKQNKEKQNKTKKTQLTIPGVFHISCSLTVSFSSFHPHSLS